MHGASCNVMRISIPHIQRIYKQESIEHVIEYMHFRCSTERLVLHNVWQINQIDITVEWGGWSWEHLVGEGQRGGHAVKHLVQSSEHVLVISKQGLLGRKKECLFHWSTASTSHICCPAFILFHFR